MGKRWTGASGADIGAIFGASSADIGARTGVSGADIGAIFGASGVDIGAIFGAGGVDIGARAGAGVPILAPKLVPVRRAKRTLCSLAVTVKTMPTVATTKRQHSRA